MFVKIQHYIRETKEEPNYIYTHIYTYSKIFKLISFEVRVNHFTNELFVKSINIFLSEY
jgi:hypothetical protein